MSEEENDQTKAMPSIVLPTNRRYIQSGNQASKKPVNHKQIAQAAEKGEYIMEAEMAQGAESVLYVSTCAGTQVCVKAVRNLLNKLIGSSMTRGQTSKLTKVAYHTKVRHIKNEFDIGKSLFTTGESKLVHIYALRQVTRFGLEVGYDLVMELLPGQDLSNKALMQQLSVVDKMKVCVQCVKALACMHKAKLLHLDIKPSNFMYYNGTVRLFDFGVSVVNGYKLRSIAGTAGYLSPEQICKETLNESTDLFALGVTFNILFGGKTLPQTLEAICQRTAKNEAIYQLANDDQPMVTEFPELANYPGFAEILKRCTIPKREARMPNCQVLLHQLKLWAEENRDKVQLEFD